jgi:PAN domain
MYRRRILTLSILAMVAFTRDGTGVFAQAPAEPGSAADRASCGQHTTFHQSVPALGTTAVADSTAQDLVRLIVAQVGMTANFRARAAGFGNVAATLCQDQDPPVRYILYDPRLVSSVTPDTPNYWTLMLALAHEVGHHVNSHVLDGKAGLAEKERPRMELEADFFAGYVLARLGAPQEYTSASASKLAGFQAGAAGLTPDSEQQNQRLFEVERGWREGQKGGGPARAATSGASGGTETASTIARLSIQPDTFVEGEGYHAITSASVPICREACSRDSRCAMYEFHRPTRTCGLFDHASPSGRSGDAEVGIKNPRGAQLKPEPDEPARKTAVAGWMLTLKPETYVQGEGYKILRETSPPMCRQACLADIRCSMFEFYKPNATCGLFDHTRTAGASRQAEVGLKTRIATPSIEARVLETPPAAARLAVRQNVYVQGQGYRVLRESSAGACRAACLGDNRCSMYEFYRPSQNCGLFDHTRLAGPSADAEAGIKVAR